MTAKAVIMIIFYVSCFLVGNQVLRPFYVHGSITLVQALVMGFLYATIGYIIIQMIFDKKESE